MRCRRDRLVGALRASFGRSIADPRGAAERGVLCRIPDLLVWVEHDGWIAHNRRVRVDAGQTTESVDLDAAQRRMLCFVHVASQLLLDGRVTPPAESD